MNLMIKFPISSLMKEKEESNEVAYISNEGEKTDDEVSNPIIFSQAAHFVQFHVLDLLVSQRDNQRDFQRRHGGRIHFEIRHGASEYNTGSVTFLMLIILNIKF